ncbi:class A beta-lactamase-related serine hydrolase [Bacteroides xylanisolvens]|uniref:class A beta-lactamase-related serine hydrolase n=1 Tax=Bacteroides xylanisolvens TaxID=371601 RepID=UPI001F5A8EDD|nr:class A beta-lactamase-related serine hydrolase [Bacteroides xylanisolvens]
MKGRLLIIIFISICFIAGSCNVSSVQGSRYNFSSLDSVIQGWVSKEYYPGASICIVKNDSVIFQKNYGSYTPDTKVYVASAGKWVAAAVIGAVVDSTSLDWDDPVEKWLPEFKGDAKGKILLRQLLSHTSGVRPYLPEPRVDNYNHLDSAIIEILPLDTVFTPGSRFQYGGLAMQIAGRMAEVAMGKEFETLFQELLAQPLEMKNSHFTPINTDGGHAPMLGGGLCTTLNDYIHFLSMIYHEGMYEGKRILTAETVKEMQANQVKDALVSPGEYTERALGQSHTGIYGLGEWRELIDKKTGEAYQISSPGWAGAYPWINKRDSVYGFFITHVAGSSAKEDGFSSFYGSPVISRTVSEILKGNSLVIKQGRINVGNGSLYYEEAGQGEPIIFVHGHSLDHRMWDEQFSVFAKKYHVIRYDLRGYGISSSQTEDYQFMHAEDLITLMDSLRIPKAHIVGLSLGGFITADMLAYFPDRMLSAFLASGNIRKSKGPSEPMTPEEARVRDKEIAALKEKGVDVMKKEWFEGLMKSGGSQRERMRESLWQMIDEWDAWQPLHKEVRVVAGLDAIEKLKKNHPDVPALIVEGHSSSNRFSKEPPILQYLPNGKLKVIDDCGHMLNMERPEEFNAALEEFLKSAQ